MKANVLLLLLAATCSHFARTDAQSTSLNDCPLSIFGETKTNVDIRQGTNSTQFCFTADDPSLFECVQISSANELTHNVAVGVVTTELEELVKAQLPQVVGTVTCFLEINFSAGGQLSMNISLMSFGSQTVMGVHLTSYEEAFVDVQSLDSISGFTANFPTAEGENTKYLDLSGCRFEGQVIFPASDVPSSENCINHLCSAQGELSEEGICGAKETCVTNTCQPLERVCTVTGGQVIQFFGGVSSIPDRCLYSLLEPATGSSFVLLAAFQDRRSQIMTFLDRLDLILPSSDVTFSIDTSGTVRLNDEIQTLGTAATEVEGVSLSKNEAGVTLEISNEAISIFFDGSTAHIKVPDGAPLQGLCGNPSNTTYSPIRVSDSRSTLGCERMPRTDNLLLVDSVAGMEHCSLLGTQPFAACHSKVPVEPHIQSCNATLSGYPIVDNLKCQFFEAYAQVCKQQFDIDLGDWRVAVDCPSSNQTYCQDHTCSANEFCGDSRFKKNTCLCRAIFASQYKLKNTLGDPPVCQEDRGSISLIGCLLEEDGIDYTTLHLKDENCIGQRDSETHLVTFTFDSSNTCGTETQGNDSFVVLKNSVATGQAPNNSLITRNKFVEIDFTCVYRQPEVRTLTLQVRGSIVVRQMISQTQNYTLLMQAYSDSGRTQLLEPNAELDLNQQVWIELSADELDGNTVKIVTESCWVTQQPMPNDTLRYDLIVDGCPNIEDGTVEVVGNGLGKDNYFSFRMFQFVDSTSFYLHCNVNLCASPQCAPTCAQGRRRRALKETAENLDGGLISLEWIV
ncbi:alpha-tectorin-like isoform X2 [Hippocampus comes]|nr:PREDICTED: alpha-tectorin-like isoform X2 [Hippocampus comes]